ncbi:MAG: Ig-like domain-containing protein, partial [Trueperaceae bacterium]|nr:Ig-like domain-containing protein [Trueperaceae bacterium]
IAEVEIAERAIKLEVGETYSLEIDRISEPVSWVPITLSSSNSSVVRTDGSYKVEGVGVGSATVTAYAEEAPSVSDTVEVTVVLPQILTVTDRTTPERGGKTEYSRGSVTLSFAGANNLEGLEVVFGGVPDGVRFEEQARGPDWRQDGYIVIYDVIAAKTARLGPSTVRVEATLGGRKHLGSVIIDVEPHQPAILVKSFSVGQRYADYPTISMRFEYLGEQAVENADISARCEEDGYDGLYTRFNGNVTRLVPERSGSVNLPYSSGFPYFTDNVVRCSFSARGAGESIRVEYSDD